MNKHKIFSILLFLAGEALIVICFFYFGRNLDSNILMLNIIVSSIIFFLFFIDILFPFVDFKDKSQKTVGSLGIFWFYRGFYMLVAIAAMAFFNIVKSADFNTQIIIQGIIFFVLCLGLFFAFFSSQNVKQVFDVENQNRNRLDEMIIVTKDAIMKLGKEKNIPDAVITRMETLQNNLRFISPCNTQNAFELETSFIDEIKAVQNCFFETPVNGDKLMEHIQNCERIYIERKQNYSNQD